MLTFTLLHTVLFVVLATLPLGRAVTQIQEKYALSLLDRDCTLLPSILHTLNRLSV